uniref:p53 DNA-binding domain-containing protein n=1 Tax=Anopheles atroparvus TaxID=41427 RepID=A0AAG5CWA8_ANOAO
MATPDDDSDNSKAEEDLFPTGGCSQISVLNFDSDILANNAMEFVTRIADDGISLPTLTQDSLNDDGANFLPSSLDPTGKFPSTEEFCHSRASFLVVMPNTEGSGFVYSQKLQKLYLKVDSVCAFEARCDVPHGDAFYLRAMLVSVVPESQHEPLLRCRNHQAKDEGTENDYIKEHVVRCKNEQHEYVGRGLGAFFEDRCAVRVPLEADATATRLTLQFACQNTCFSPGLRKTALVFTLEDAGGHVWGRRIVHIKICTNYRRDMLNEEKASLLKSASVMAGKKTQPVGRPRKRRLHDGGAGPSGRGKATRQNPTIEPHQVTLVMPSLRMAKRVLESAIGIISATVLRVDDEQVKTELIQYVETLRKQRQSMSISNSQCSVDSVLL